MKIKITEKIISIPPFLSTTWDKVTSMQSEREPGSPLFTLVFHLSDGNMIRIPSLDASIVEIAFLSHTAYLEKNGNKAGGAAGTEANPLMALLNLPPDQFNSMPLRFNLGSLNGGMDGVEGAFQHNPAQSEAPPLPADMLEKIAKIASVMSNGDFSQFPKPEPHCNCFHCQILRAILGKQKEEPLEEIVTEEELKFRNWDIKQVGDQLYLVTNPLDPKEQYNVFLGSPIGCTCGSNNCEHVRAVLYS